MKYTEEMILHSDSGYCMPFAEPDGRDVSLSLGYGEQNHPESGEKFFHHGIDFDVRRYLLSAVASGVVSGVGNDPTHGICQTIRYGQYEVTYGHLSNVFAQFGRQVKAGQTVAMSGDLLHVGVKFKGEEMDPLEFLAMLYGNIKAMQEAGGDSADGFYDGAPETDYERDREEIERLMFRFLPLYMDDLRLGRYTVPEHTEQSLRNIFTTGAMKAYFYERMPSMANPLGLGQKALPLVCKVQNLLIADFLNYLALRHEVYLSTMGGGNLKKKLRAEAVASSGIIDPLAELDIDIQSFDIPRAVTVYPDRAGIRWWTKAWFNNREEGEASVEIERTQAVDFIHDRIRKDACSKRSSPSRWRCTATPSNRQRNSY